MDGDKDGNNDSGGDSYGNSDCGIGIEIQLCMRINYFLISLML